MIYHQAIFLPHWDDDTFEAPHANLFAIAATVRDFRYAAQLSQAALAKRAGVTVRVVRNIEAAHFYFLIQLVQVCAALNLNYKDVLHSQTKTTTVH